MTSKLKSVNAILSSDQWLVSVTEEEFRKAQLIDPDLCHVIKWLEEYRKPMENELQITSLTCRHYWLNQKLLVMKDGLLLYKWIDHTPMGCCIIM